MKRFLWLLLASIIAISACDVEPGHTYSGSGGIWVMAKGDFLTRNFPGTQAGFNAALTYCNGKGGGFIQLGPGTDGLILPDSLAGVALGIADGFVPKNISILRLKTEAGPDSGSYEVVGGPFVVKDRRGRIMLRVGSKNSASGLDSSNIRIFSSLEVEGTVNPEGDLHLDLGKWIKWVDGGGSARSAVRMDSTNNLIIRNPSSQSIKFLDQTGLISLLDMTNSTTNLRINPHAWEKFTAEAGAFVRDSFRVGAAAALAPTIFGGKVTVYDSLILKRTSNIVGNVKVVDGYRFTKDIAGIQAAIDSLPLEGGTVYIPAGNYSGTATIYTPCDRPVNILGAGVDISANGGTQIINESGNDVIRLRGNFSTVRDLWVNGGAVSPAADQETGRGIVLGRRNITDPHPPPGIGASNEITFGGGGPAVGQIVDNVTIYQSASWGVSIPGDGTLPDLVTTENGALAGTSISIFATLKNVHVQSPKKFGGMYIGMENTTIHLYDCVLDQVGAGKAGADAYYLWARAVHKLVVDQASFEGFAPGTKAWVQMSGRSQTFRDCYFEEDDGDASGLTPPYFIQVLNGTSGLTIDSPVFIRASSTSGGRPRLITVGTTSYGVNILNPNALITVTPFSGGSWIETNHINLGGSVNKNVSVFGPGRIIDTTSGLNFKIQYSNFPINAVFLDEAARLDTLTVNHHLIVSDSLRVNKTSALIGDLIAGTPGTAYLATLGQGATGSDGASLRIRSGNSGSTEANLLFNRNGTDLFKILHNGSNGIMGSTGGFVFKDGPVGSDIGFWHPTIGLRIGDANTPAGGLDVKKNAVVGDSLRANLGVQLGGARITRHLSNTAVLDFDLTAVVSQDLTISVPGSALGDVVTVGVPNGSVTADTIFFGWVSSTGNVSIRAIRVAGTPNPASGTFRADVWQH